METYQIRYFIAVANTENMRAASEELNISPSALSKAISKLEEELEIKLFERVGRNIKITASGKSFKQDTAELLALERKIVEKYNSNLKNNIIKIVGSELALSHWAPKLIKKLQQYDDQIRFELQIVDNKKVIDSVEDYSADIALLCSSSKRSGKFYKEITKVKFKTFISKNHPLSQVKKVKVNELLNYHFVTMDSDMYGEHSSNVSNDGWRDDKLKRENITVIKSLKILENLLNEGLSIAYLPDYFGNSLKLIELDILNCPYSCNQNIYAVRAKYGLEKLWSFI